MDSVNKTYKFEATYCSNCGQTFGPGDSGFSHCESHAGLFPVTVRAYGPADWVQAFEKIKAEASAQTMAEQQQAKEKSE
jgi:uncharacterized OB-fold protein